MAPRHEQIAPHGRILLASPPATILGKSPIKLSETPPNPTSVLREMPPWRGAQDDEREEDRDDERDLQKGASGLSQCIK